MTTRRPRRTAEQVKADIQDAVRSELVDRGYDGVTFDGVARAADMNKSVLYRRFPDRASMVLDALVGAGVPAALPSPRGELRADLIAWLTTAVDRVMLLGADTYRGIIGEAKDETLTKADALLSNVTDLLEDEVIAAARERGELGPGPLDPVTVQAPLRVLRDEMIFGASGDVVTEIVDHIALPLYRAASAR